MRVFISYASEDRDFVRPLAQALKARGVEVWFDEWTIRWGDSITSAIDHGLGQSDFGIVVLSQAYFRKKWTKVEQDAVVHRSVGNRERFLLPIWHGVSADDVERHSSILRDRKGVDSSEGPERIADSFVLVASVAEAPLLVPSSGLGVFLDFDDVNRYFNPPREIPKLGYEVEGTTFTELTGTLRPREILMAHGSPYGSHYAAGHVTREARLLEFQRDWWFPPTFYAVDARKVLQGFDAPLSRREVVGLLGQVP